MYNWSFWEIFDISYFIYLFDKIIHIIVYSVTFVLDSTPKQNYICKSSITKCHSLDTDICYLLHTWIFFIWHIISVPEWLIYKELLVKSVWSQNWYIFGLKIDHKNIFDSTIFCIIVHFQWQISVKLGKCTPIWFLSIS